jgi:hypothetical protein
MGVKPHSVGPCKMGCFTHELFGHREGAAGCENDLSHGGACIFVIGFDDPLAVPQYLILRLYYRVGRKTAIFLAQRHGTTARRKPDAQR